MKNIISNTCIAASITNEQLKTEYQNPFCWCVIDAKSMYNLISNYNKINFKNTELYKDKNWNFFTNIDNQVKIKWEHYKFSAIDSKIKTNKPNVYWNKIWEYIQEKYDTRVNRMLNNKKEPIFIIGSLHTWHYYSESEIKKICSIKTNYKIIIANNNMDFSKEFPNIIFHKTKLTDAKNNNFVLAKEIFETYKNLLI